MSKIKKNKKINQNISLTDRRERLRTLYFILPTLNTPDVEKSVFLKQTLITIMVTSICFFFVVVFL